MGDRPRNPQERVRREHRHCERPKGAWQSVANKVSFSLRIDPPDAALWVGYRFSMGPRKILSVAKGLHGDDKRDAALWVGY